jgi:DNA-binding PadR family transcriptional regulator
MYELIILSLLAAWPLHGYLIAKITNDIIGPYARLSNGRLYPLLAKLEAAGLIAAEETTERQPGARRQRRYAITPEGRRRFHDLMLDTTSSQGDYQRIFWNKLPGLYLLDPPERLYLLDHYITFCQTHIFHLNAEIADMPRHTEHFAKAPATRLTSTMYVMEHAMNHWRLELEDTQRWRARVIAETDHTTAARDSRGAPQP